MMNLPVKGVASLCKHALKQTGRINEINNKIVLAKCWTHPWAAPSTKQRAAAAVTVRDDGGCWGRRGEKHIWNGWEGLTKKKRTPNKLFLTLFFHLERKLYFLLLRKTHKLGIRRLLLYLIGPEHKDSLCFYFVQSRGRIFRTHLLGQHSSSERLSILFKFPPLESKTTGFSLVVFQIAVLLLARLHCLVCVLHEPRQARVLPLPPQARRKWWRQTLAAAFYEYLQLVKKSAHTRLNSLAFFFSSVGTTAYS